MKTNARWMMGQAADDLVEGFCCSECGIYFQAPHGYPVLCKECHRQQRDKKNGLPKATENELG